MRRQKKREHVPIAATESPEARIVDFELEKILGNGKSSKKSRAQKKKRLLIAAATAVVLIAAIWIFNPFGTAQTSTAAVYREYVVERGDIVVGQTETSSISLMRETIEFPVSAMVEEVYVKPGASVKTGDPLVRLNLEDIEAALKSYDLQVEVMALGLEQAKLQLDTKLLQAKHQLESSKEAGSLAKDNEAVTIAELQLNLDKANTALANAQIELSAYTQLSATFSSDYRRLIELEDNVSYFQSQVSGLQSQISSTVDYNDLLVTAQKELDSAWKQFQAAAVNLDYDSIFTGIAGGLSAAEDLATNIGSYFSMNTLSPGTINTMMDADTYTNAIATIEAWKAPATGTTQTNLTTLKTALAAMQSQAEDIKGYMENASGSSSNKAALEAQLSAAQAELSSYQSAYNQFKEYYTSTYGNVKDAEELEKKVISLEADVTAAQLSLAKAELSAQTGATTAEQKRESAVAEAKNAGTTYELTEMELRQVVDTAQEEYNTLLALVEEIKGVISEDGIVSAPCNGMVSSVTASAGSMASVTTANSNNSGNNSQQVTQYAQLLTMTNISDVYVPVTISEENILSVSLGQEAAVSMTAFPGEVFSAVVDQISVESARIGAATVSYNVTVRYAEQNERNMYEGMSAEVTLIQRAVRDVLYVNKQAIANVDGISTVLVKGENGEPIPTQVKTGFTDGRYVEITSGLQEGDVILMESAIGGRE